MKHERYSYLDFLKIIACFLVIVNHTNSDIFMGVQPSATWFVSLTYFFISKIAVPIYLLCSGVVLLNKQDTPKKSITRIVKIALAIVLFSAIYYFRDNPITVDSIVAYIPYIYQKCATSSLWYLYLYLGLMIALPFLQKLALVMKKADYLYFFSISIVFLGVIPIIGHFFPKLQYVGNINLLFFSTFFGLLFLGHYIHQYSVYKKRYMVASVIVFIVGTAISVFGSYLLYQQDSGNYLFFDNRWYLTITAPAIALFYIAKHTIKIHSAWISKIGSCTFGIYLLTEFLIHLLKPVLREISFIATSHMIIQAIILQFVVFVVGLIITLLLQKIPLIKKILL